MRVLLSRRAETDLEDIAERIAMPSPAAALLFIGKLRGQCLKIAELPHAWPTRPEWGRDVRITVSGRYLIVHRVRDETLQILRIVHGARDLVRLFEDDPLPE